MSHRAPHRRLRVIHPATVNAYSVHQSGLTKISGSVHRRVGEQVLTFRPAPDGPGETVARDDETGTYWTLSGEAVAGELAGRTLDRHPHWDDLFWFSWAAFRPDTRVFTSEATSSA
ncbi:DUF3179 domain-containing protein [Haloplanus salinus]|uniref:DUF3179 domain-containing protein n=1 Tax=Haloplanus salinus TaxID=1126245 RepID=A0A368N4S4_9EURY|nr:DUF3179 domain-containing protein [Haloplanus salinus]